MTNYRWTICAMLFFATTVNYLDRQVLSLTWDEFIKPEFHWDESHYGTITSVFSIVYAICMLFAGRFIDWMGTKKGYLWAIGVWSFGACLHAGCGIATEHYVGMKCSRIDCSDRRCCCDIGNREYVFLSGCPLYSGIG